jgi:lipoprotein-releasing system ATP-binding protein
LLNIIGLLEPATAGRMSLAGHDTGALSDAQLTELRGAAIGFVFQFHHLLPAFTALENVLMPLMIAHGSVQPADEALARDLLASVGLSQALAKRPGELSGGMQQRVALARALARRPRLILADEPTGNLDRVSADEVFALLRRFNREHGSACLIVTHDASLASRCDRRIELVDGHLLAPPALLQA